MSCDAFGRERFAAGAHIDVVAETIGRLRDTRNRLLADRAESGELLSRMARIVNELRDMHANAVLTRTTALVALEEISTATKQRGELETAAIADKALRDVYARVR